MGHLMRGTLVSLLSIASFSLAEAKAQNTFGALSNFDVVNDTGSDCHGFEIELEGISSQDVTYTFGAPYERYGDPQIVDSPDSLGNPRVFVRYKSTWDSATQSFLQATPVAPSPFTATDGHACYLGGPIGNYSTSGCEHFGVGTLGNPTKTTYRWLKGDPQNPGNLLATGTNVSIPAPMWNIIPPAVPQQPPVVQAALPAEPPVFAEFGEAQWVKVFKTEAPEPAELHHLLTDDPNVPQEQGEVEIEWVLLQPSRNGGENELVNEAQVGEGNESVTRRYEFYKYTGTYDPENHEAQPIMLPHDIPQADQIGDYIGAQMAAVNLDQGLSVLNPNLPDGRTQETYPSRPLVFGGSLPYTITLLQGAIPEGLNLDLNDGILYGTPTVSGQFSFSLHAEDSAGATKDGNFQILVKAADLCPEDPSKESPGICGCGIADTDSDSDGTVDCQDQCSADPQKQNLGICGCGFADTDSDSDGIADCLDSCQLDPMKSAPGVCGCGTADIDTDGDGSPDCVDQCSNDINKTSPGVCGCNTPDVDSNNNGTMDCVEVSSSADLAISLTPSSPQAKKNDDMELTMKVRNLGPDTADAVVTSLSCSGVPFKVLEMSRGCAWTGSGFACALGNLNTGTGKQKTVQIKPTAKGVLNCEATVGSPTKDSNLGNQQAQAVVTVK